MAKLRGALDDLATARAEHPGDDLISAMIAAEDEGARLSHEQVVVTTMTFLTAGFESTNNLLTNIAHALAQIDGLFETVKADPAWSPALAEEGSRWDSAAQGFVRSPTRDVELHGKTIPAGAQVLVHIGSANRDERQFPDPDDLPARPRQHPPAGLRPRHPLLRGRPARADAGPHLLGGAAGRDRALGARLRDRPTGEDAELPRLHPPRRHHLTAPTASASRAAATQASCW